MNNNDEFISPQPMSKPTGLYLFYPWADKDGNILEVTYDDTTHKGYLGKYLCEDLDLCSDGSLKYKGKKLHIYRVSDRVKVEIERIESNEKK